VKPIAVPDKIYHLHTDVAMSRFHTNLDHNTKPRTTPLLLARAPDGTDSDSVAFASVCMPVDL